MLCRCISGSDLIHFRLIGPDNPFRNGLELYGIIPAAGRRYPHSHLNPPRRGCLRSFAYQAPPLPFSLPGAHCNTHIFSPFLLFDVICIFCLILTPPLLPPPFCPCREKITLYANEALILFHGAGGFHHSHLIAVKLRRQDGINSIKSAFQIFQKFQSHWSLVMQMRRVPMA